MHNIDPIPLPYGPLQYYQIHYIVDIRSNDNDKFLARCKPITKGHLQSKRIVDVKWTGDDNFAKILQSDTDLTDMLKEVMIKVREITIDPQDDHIRIYSRWIHEENLAFDPLMLEIADRIALYIKKIVHKSE
jgi:beta-mannanase